MQWHLGEISTHAVGGSSGWTRAERSSEWHGWGACPVAARTVTHWCCVLLSSSWCVSVRASSVQLCAADDQLSSAVSRVVLLVGAAAYTRCHPSIPPLSSKVSLFCSRLIAAPRAYVPLSKSPPRAHLCVQLSCTTNKCMHSQHICVYTYPRCSSPAQCSNFNLKRGVRVAARVCACT